eukprot:13875-Pelagococcus_subviridis.AAC.1
MASDHVSSGGRVGGVPREATYVGMGGVQRRQGWSREASVAVGVPGLKPRGGGRRDAPGKVLKDRRSPRRR